MIFGSGLRRLRTVLRSARNLYGKKRLKPLEAAFKRFGDATNALRDAEVLAETLALAEVEAPARDAVDRWLAERRRRQDELRDQAIDVIGGDELERAFGELLAALEEPPGKDLSMKRFASSRLAAVQAGVSEMLPVARDDVAALHRLRIRFKRLRYTAEMLDRFTAVGQSKHKGKARDEPRSFAKIAKQAQRMQKHLGVLHDADVALETVAACEMLAAKDRDELTRSLLTFRARLVDESVNAVQALPPWVLGS